MALLDTHPTVALLRGRPAPAGRQTVSLQWLRELCLRNGADDVGFVAVDRPEVADQRSDVLALLPEARTLIAFVRRMHRESLRAPARSVANLDFHQTTDEINQTGRSHRRGSGRTGRARAQSADGIPDGDGSLGRRSSGWCRTSRSRSPPDSVRWAFTAT